MKTLSSKRFDVDDDDFWEEVLPFSMYLVGFAKIYATNITFDVSMKLFVRKLQCFNISFDDDDDYEKEVEEDVVRNTFEI